MNLINENRCLQDLSNFAPFSQCDNRISLAKNTAHEIVRIILLAQNEFFLSLFSE